MLWLQCRFFVPFLVQLWWKWTYVRRSCLRQQANPSLRKGGLKQRVHGAWQCPLLQNTAVGEGVFV